MRTVSIINLALVALLVVMPAVTSAHILKTDGAIGVVIHLSPDDAPLAGAPTPIFFSFKNTEGDFDITQCECALYVAPYVERERIDLEKPDVLIHTHGNPATADASYVFPSPDIYAVRVVGKPLPGATFAAFDVIFDVRVAEYAAGASRWNTLFQGHGLHLAIFGGGFLFFLAAVLYERYRKQMNT